MTADRSLAPTIKKMLATADQYGIKFPKARKDLDAALNLVEEIEGMDLGSNSSVSHAIFTAVKAGRDPLADEGVKQAVVEHNILSLVSSGNVTAVARDNLFNVAVDNLEAIFAAFKPVYDDYGVKLSNAHSIIYGAGIESLESPAILSAGETISNANNAARAARKALTDLDQALSTTLVATIGLNNSSVGQIVRKYDIGSSTPLEAVRVSNNRGMGFWDALTAGYTISLASPTETQLRVDEAVDRELMRDRRAMAEHTSLVGRSWT